MTDSDDVQIAAALPDPPDAFVEDVATLDASASAADGHRSMGEHVVAELRAGAVTMPHAGFAARSQNEGTLLGYAHLSERATPLGWRLDVVVDPAHRRDGIGSRLVAAALDRARADDGQRVHLWCWNARPERHDHERLAARSGMHPAQTIERMSAPLPLSRTAGRSRDLGPGITLRPFRPGQDNHAWLDAHNEIFADHPDAGGWNEDDLAWQLAETWFDPEGFIVAEDAVGIAGYCWMKLESEAAWVYFLGVLARERGTGLGRVLAVAGAEWAAGRGARTCLLYVDPGNAAAVNTYRSLGFEPDHRDVAYALELSRQA
jgi:mycothiol synthase